MFYTYVLIDKNRNFYAGFSDNLKQRINEHRSAKVYSTRKKLPVQLVYYEACKNRYDALKREKYLKSGPGRKYLRNRLRNFLRHRASENSRPSLNEESRS